MEKARELPADALILDLEDAVAPDAKAKARELVVRRRRNGGFGSREVLIRINALDTAWWRDDLARRGRRRPGCDPGAESLDAATLHEVGKHLVERQRAETRPHLGDDGNAARHAQCR